MTDDVVQRFLDLFEAIYDEESAMHELAILIIHYYGEDKGNRLLKELAIELGKQKKEK